MYLCLVYLSSILCFIGVDLTKIDKCIGDTEADVDNPVLKAEQDAQVRLFLNFIS